MKTLFYTCIFSNLYGTEYGGRCNRYLHYRHSLLSILNLQADKFICFTSKQEIDDLKNFFYIKNNISENILEFIVFDLEQTEYFEDIKKLKKIEEMIKLDRCYEIQYNKFFWLEHLKNKEQYDRIFWIDAGLSHGGIIHNKYQFGEGYEKNFKYNIFNKKLLDRLCELTKEKILLLSKQNDGLFFWSQTIPEKYYISYKRDKHIIGGLFGGKVELLLKYKEKFEILLKELLQNEKKLYYEELIMSCLYFNNVEMFNILKFDDWYDRKDPKKYGNYVRYFYNCLEVPKTCICTLCICLEDCNKHINNTKKLIESNLKYTNFDILVLTNKPLEFKEIEDARLIIIDYDSNFKESITSGNKFNMHLKRYPISIGKKMNYDVIFYNDCDCYVEGWDEESFQKKINEDYDIFFPRHANPQLGSLIQNYKHFKDKIEQEFGDLYTKDMDMSPNPAETRIIFKNNEKLDVFLNFWNKISNKNKNFFTYYDGVYFGTSSIFAKMRMTGVNKNDIFSKYCFISHADKTLNYFGEIVK